MPLSTKLTIKANVRALEAKLIYCACSLTLAFQWACSNRAVTDKRASRVLPFFTITLLAMGDPCLAIRLKADVIEGLSLKRKLL